MSDWAFEEALEDVVHAVRNGANAAEAASDAVDQFTADQKTLTLGAKVLWVARLASAYGVNNTYVGETISSPNPHDVVHLIYQDALTSTFATVAKRRVGESPAMTLTAESDCDLADRSPDLGESIVHELARVASNQQGDSIAEQVNSVIRGHESIDQLDVVDRAYAIEYTLHSDIDIIPFVESEQLEANARDGWQPPISDSLFRAAMRPMLADLLNDGYDPVFEVPDDQQPTGPYARAAKKQGFDQDRFTSPVEVPEPFSGGEVENTGGFVMNRIWHTAPLSVSPGQTPDSKTVYQCGYGADPVVTLSRYRWDDDEETFYFDGEIDREIPPENTDFLKANVASQMMSDFNRPNEPTE